MRALGVIFFGAGAVGLGIWAFATRPVSLTLAAGAALCLVLALLTALRKGRGSASHRKPGNTLPDLAAYSSSGVPTRAVDVSGDPGDAAPVAEDVAEVAMPELVTEEAEPVPEGDDDAPEAQVALTPTPVFTAPSDGERGAVKVLSQSPAVRTPFSVQPTVVLMSLFDAAAERADTLATHLWLQDTASKTLRLIAAFGPRVPASSLMPLSDPILGAAATSGSAVFASLGTKAVHDPTAELWRYAIPVGTPEMRGVAAVDIATSELAPTAGVLNDIAAVLRGSLTAAIAIHVAHSEMEAAVQLLQAAQELASGLGRDDVIAAALERAMRVAGASTGSVMLPDPETGALRIVASKGLPEEIVRDTRLEPGQGIAGVVYDTGAPLLVEDLPGGPGARRHGVLSSASVPIGDAEGNIGVLNVGSRAFPARLTDMYLRALGILGSQAALAIRASEAVERSWDSYLENLQALATALEANDPYVAGSSKRIADLSVAVAHAMGMHPDEVVSLRIAAILHDVGMGLATGSVGSADRPLSTIDRGLVRAHPKVAADVMSTVPSLERLAPIVRHHHERFDGTGYDTGLSGDSIPLGSRILSVVDAYVSMTSPRAYRAALTWEDALNELSASAGTQFDPHVVQAFHGVVQDRPDLALRVVPQNHD